MKVLREQVRTWLSFSSATPCPSLGSYCVPRPEDGGCFSFPTSPHWKQPRACRARGKCLEGLRTPPSLQPLPIPLPEGHTGPHPTLECPCLSLPSLRAPRVHIPTKPPLALPASTLIPHCPLCPSALTPWLLVQAPCPPGRPRTPWGAPATAGQAAVWRALS